MRLINADALKKALVEHMDAFVDSDGSMMYSDHLLCGADYEDLCEFIDKQPTIQPEPHWIPYTGKCDLMDNEEVLVFQKDGTINGQIRHAMFYDFNGKKKFVTWEEGITIYNVLAYMPLPEPFKGVTE